MERAVNTGLAKSIRHSARGGLHTARPHRSVHHLLVFLNWYSLDVDVAEAHRFSVAVQQDCDPTRSVHTVFGIRHIGKCQLQLRSTGDVVLALDPGNREHAKNVLSTTTGNKRERHMSTSTHAHSHTRILPHCHTATLFTLAYTHAYTTMVTNWPGVIVGCHQSLPAIVRLQVPSKDGVQVCDQRGDCGGV